MFFAWVIISYVIYYLICKVDFAKVIQFSILNNKIDSMSD